MCPHTTTYVSSYDYIWYQDAVDFLHALGIPHDRLGACLLRYPRVLDVSAQRMESVYKKKIELKQKSLLYLLRSHATIYVSSHYYTTTMYLARSCYCMCPHSAVCINAGCAVSGGCGAHSAHESEQDRRGYALAPWPQVLNTP